jgi:hypothetical protein
VVVELGSPVVDGWVVDVDGSGGGGRIGDGRVGEEKLKSFLFLKNFKKGCF